MRILDDIDAAARRGRLRLCALLGWRRPHGHRDRLLARPPRARRRRSRSRGSQSCAPGSRASGRRPRRPARPPSCAAGGGAGEAPLDPPPRQVELGRSGARRSRPAARAPRPQGGASGSRAGSRPTTSPRTSCSARRRYGRRQRSSSSRPGSVYPEIASKPVSTTHGATTCSSACAPWRPRPRAVMLIGHNPGAARAHLHSRPAGPDAFPTGALAEPRLAIDDWQRVRPGCGRLEVLVVPRALPD